MLPVVAVIVGMLDYVACSRTLNVIVGVYGLDEHGRRLILACGIAEVSEMALFICLLCKLWLWSSNCLAKQFITTY